MIDLSAKHQHVLQLLREMKRVVVAFSAGVDSTLVLKLALDALGRENVIAATGVSPSLALSELDSVRQLASIINAPLELVNTSEMDDPNYVANPVNRCYFCKSELYDKLTALAEKRGYGVVVNGINADDAQTHTYGMTAAREHTVRSPLLEANISKNEVRALAAELGLPNWKKPALACLSSRIPFGSPVTIQSLKQIEQAEAFLRQQGFVNVRVRHHQNVARVEVDSSDLLRLVTEPLRTMVVDELKKLGYTYVTLDLQGFRSGSGNEAVGRKVSLAQIG